MPIYEYRCPQGHVFELFQRIGDEAPEGCEVCGEGPVQRVLYPVAVHFKGSGFYSTDYGRGSRKRDGGGKDGDSSGEGSSSSDSKDAGSTEKKAAEAS